MRNKIHDFFKPAPFTTRIRDEEIDKKYFWCRWAIFESTFIGYALFYIVRNNLATVSKEIEGALRYDHSMIGDILAITAIGYGLGKFLMGSLSDRSNPQRFMPFGLLLTALINFTFGSVSSYPLHVILWGINGLVQGMGWPPCGRSLGHWFSVKERGTVFAFWNIAHNVGGGIAGIIAAWAATHWGWRSAFYFPGAIAILGAVYLFFRLHDTPQADGLPSIEEYHCDYPEDEVEDHERELGTKELFLNNIVYNKYLWLFAAANFFVYIVRYSMLDWGPTYLKEMKQATLQGGGLSVLVLELGGIPSTILMGWLSDKLGGRRGMVSMLCMFPILAAFAVIHFNPPGHLWIDMVCFGVIGFFVYPPVMLLGVVALDLTSKKAVGTAAGFVGLFGYLGRTVQAKGLGYLAQYYTWNDVITAIYASTILSIVLLAFTWNIKPRG